MWAVYFAVFQLLSGFLSTILNVDTNALELQLMIISIINESTAYFHN